VGTMTSPTYDSAFVDELVNDVEAYILRADVLTDFAESQVEERVRLARLVNRLASDCDGLQAKVSELQQHIDVLDSRIRAMDRSIAFRLTRVPRRVWRTVRGRRSL
jgi:SMC interacting uncharacterized protein involved in chromosome segregation